jgi:nitric oxide synthase-interacting protein
MSRHSKRNTASSFFTAFERSLLNKDYGTLKARLGSHSFRHFDACKLCLARARQPVVCPSHGDLFCRECIMENLLSQRHEIKIFEKEMERRKQEEVETEVLEDEAVQERAVREFELVQMGLSGKKSGGGGDMVERREGKGVVSEMRGDKRKFELDEEELIQIARADREKAKKAITEEKVTCVLIEMCRDTNL